MAALNQTCKATEIPAVLFLAALRCNRVSHCILACLDATSLCMFQASCTQANASIQASEHLLWRPLLLRDFGWLLPGHHRSVQHNLRREIAMGRVPGGAWYTRDERVLPGMFQGTPKLMAPLYLSQLLVSGFITSSLNERSRPAPSAIGAAGKTQAAFATARALPRWARLLAVAQWDTLQIRLARLAGADKLAGADIKNTAEQGAIVELWSDASFWTDCLQHMQAQLLTGIYAGTAIGPVAQAVLALDNVFHPPGELLLLGPTTLFSCC